MIVRLLNLIDDLSSDLRAAQTEIQRLRDENNHLMDATAVAAYHAQTNYPVVRLLVCDDAPQWAWLTAAISGWWVHEGRHYKKLSPAIAHHRQALDRFLDDFWSFYDDLRGYPAQPTVAERVRLAAAFDTPFAAKTEYWALNNRIGKTRTRQAVLLAVLEHPEIPLHNNAAELGARQRVRKRDVSFDPRTVEGAPAWDTFMSLADTTRKFGVSFTSTSMIVSVAMVRFHRTTGGQEITLQRSYGLCPTYKKGLFPPG